MLFKSFGSRNTLRVPFDLWGYISDLTQGLHSACDVVRPFAVMSFSWASISSFDFYGDYEASVLH